MRSPRRPDRILRHIRLGTVPHYIGYALRSLRVCVVVFVYKSWVDIGREKVSCVIECVRKISKTANAIDSIYLQGI